jgi:FMN-dependent NADH-azoreductase
MKTLLRVSTSIFEESSVSSALSSELIIALSAKRDEFNVIQRDFSKQAIPHRLTAIRTPAGERSSEQQEKVAFSDSLISEIQAADVLVIGLPMYNFTVPSSLRHGSIISQERGSLLNILIRAPRVF